MLQVTSSQINLHFNYLEFAKYLQKFYCQSVTTPYRSHFDLDVDPKGTMLIMPCWSNEKYMGIKVVNVFPDNKVAKTINGVYILMSRTTGEIIAQFDGSVLTSKRTAVVSALAAKLITHRRMNTMLMIGSGKMSSELIKAHHHLQNFESIHIWGRNFDKAKTKASLLQSHGYPVSAIINKNEIIANVDLISVATHSKNAVVFGKAIKEEVYVDLVGSYKPNNREADDALLLNAKIFVDSYNAINESGDLKIPIENGIINRNDVLADIIELSNGSFVPNKSFNGKIIFKSVGFAASDLACAIYLFEKIGSD